MVLMMNVCRSFVGTSLPFLLAASAALAPGAAPAAPGTSQTDGPAVPNTAALPNWPKPTTPDLTSRAPMIRSQELELVHSREALGAFVVRVGGRPFAVGLSRPLVAYVQGDDLRWLDVAAVEGRRLNIQSARNSVRASLGWTDKDGAHWQIRQQFTPGPIPGSIEIQTEVTVDQERAVAFLPLLTLFPGAGTFGANKGQGLVAGLEYLENEPSSSEADVIGPASRRQVPDSLKLTFPLMAIQSDERYLALTWQMAPEFSALFDSPDRLFGSGGHVMGLLFPGSNGKNRTEGSLLPRTAGLLRAGQPLVLQATLLAGSGRSLAPAIEKYVASRGLPGLPAAGIDAQSYASLAAGAWLDSKIRDGHLFHHAIAGGNFPSGHAADAAVWMDWLAGKTTQTEIASRLTKSAQEALAGIAPQELNLSGVGHVRYPVATLLYGHVAETAAQAERSGQGLLGRFEADGSVKYHPAANGPDYAKTHYTNEANGVTSRVVLDLLEAAAFSGNNDLLAAGLKHLRALDKFRDGVPRGAQTWECPLHTPDILASAQMVRAYTLGYELTGDGAFLEQARYWAWTGVPFVYLVNPTPQPVGVYGTIAVFGATNWKAPVWLGLPVQWCGLVYADALYRLVRDDRGGPWKKLADGITLSGIQQNWPAGDAEKQGLLPDSFVLRSQHRNGPAINPATVEACAAHYFSETPVYDVWCSRQNNLRVHAPGAVQHAQDGSGQVAFQVEPWMNRPYFVLVNGLKQKPRLSLNGEAVNCAPPHQFLEKEGRLILQLEGKARVELFLRPS
jgi:hypothetical protein